MRQIRVAVLLCALLLSTVGFNLAAQAQSATPTLTPIPTPACTPRTAPRACLGTKLKVVWFTKDPTNAHVSVSASGCPLTPNCLAGVASGTLVSVPPLTVTLTDKDKNALSKGIGAPGQNSGGCPGGSDTYRAADRLRLVYGAAMTLIAKMTVPLASPTPPTLNPPVAVTVRDACGLVVNGTATSCLLKTSSAWTQMKCIVSPSP